MTDAVRGIWRRWFSFSASWEESLVSADPGGSFDAWVPAVVGRPAMREADWDLVRIAKSDGFRRRSWTLLLERWPGVWLRGRGRGTSLSDSSESSYTSGTSRGEAMGTLGFLAAMAKELWCS